MSYTDLRTDDFSDSKDSIGAASAYHDARSGKLEPEGEASVFLSDLRERSTKTGIPAFGVVTEAINFWRDVRGELRRAGVSNTPEPLVAVSAQGSIHFSWELSRSYVEAEFLESLTEVFFESDSNGKFESTEFRYQRAEKAAKWVSLRIESDARYQE